LEHGCKRIGFRASAMSPIATRSSSSRPWHSAGAGNEMRTGSGYEEFRTRFARSSSQGRGQGEIGEPSERAGDQSGGGVGSRLCPSRARPPLAPVLVVLTARLRSERACHRSSRFRYPSRRSFAWRPLRCSTCPSTCAYFFEYCPVGCTIPCRVAGVMLVVPVSHHGCDGVRDMFAAIGIHTTSTRRSGRGSWAECRPCLRQTTHMS
jgi:hypothetical protein